MSILLTRYRRVIPLVFALAILSALDITSVGAEDWWINEDYRQPDARAATDFEFLLKGNVGGQITGGGFTAVTNPFANPTMSASQDAFGNTIVRFVGSNSIPTSPAGTPDRHFGIYGTGTKPTVLVKAWSYPNAPTRVPVPKSNFSVGYNPQNQSLTITLENTSPDTVTFQETGYLVSPSERPIDDLRRQILPPSSFVPLTALNHQYSPGQSSSAVILGVASNAYVVTYASASFSGPSSGNLYTGVGGEWAQFRVAAHTIPSGVPGSIPLMPGWMLAVLMGLPAAAGLALLLMKAKALQGRAS